MEDKNTFGGGQQKLDRTKKLVSVGLLITGIFVVFLGIAYAFTNRSLTGTKKQVINVGNLSLELQEDDNNLTIVDAFPTYDEVGMIGNAFTFRLINKTLQDTNYILKLADITSGEKLFLEDVKCGLTKDGQVTIHLLSDLQDNTINSGVILGNQTIEYALRLWIKDSVEDDARIAGKSLSFKVEIEQTSGDVDNPTPTSTPEPSGEPATDKVFASENLGENCTTYDDGVDTFLVGQCANNYIWYSGKLWRVVLKNNETGAVKMVTDNAITAIPYNSVNQPNFENSFVDQWLNQEFLPTLHHYEDYLVTNFIWDATGLNTLSVPIRPNGVTKVERTVGLLNVYEYYTTYNNSEGMAIASTGYLNNSTQWWLMTLSSSSTVWFVSDTGDYNKNNYSQNYSPAGAHSIRPSVNLKSDIRIVSGNGSISDPFKLMDDEQEIIAGVTLFSTRYSGEYVKFNNELYRIVGVEEGLTKVTAVDIPSGLGEMKFDNAEYKTSFATARIRTNIYNNYYSNLEDKAKNMVEVSKNWYFGTVFSGGNYKSSICQVVNSGISALDCEKLSNEIDVYIGLPRIGEMFTSHITRGTKINFWTLTPDSARFVRNILWYGSSSYSSSDTALAVRPSLYLKSNVVIAKDNTGDGTYEHPYEIELGA